MEQSQIEENVRIQQDNSEVLGIKKDVFGFPLNFGKINKNTKVHNNCFMICVMIYFFFFWSDFS
jgi:hypothetical protein